MDRTETLALTKYIAVELTKGYFKNIFLNVAAFAILLAGGFIWVKIDEFRASRKN